jgi:hypothetical protein
VTGTTPVRLKAESGIMMSQIGFSLKKLKTWRKEVGVRHLCVWCVEGWDECVETVGPDWFTELSLKSVFSPVLLVHLFGGMFFEDCNTTLLAQEVLCPDGFRSRRQTKKLQNDIRVYHVWILRIMSSDPSSKLLYAGY